VQIITKRRHGLACVVEGRLILPLESGAFLIDVRSLEHGTTGVREAVVTSHLAQLGALQFDADTQTACIKGWKPSGASAEAGGSTSIGGWFQDPYDPDWTGPALYAVSDDERLDSVFPTHPLSRARHILERVRRTFVAGAAVLDRIDDWVASLLDQSQGPRPLMSDLAAGSLLLQMGRPDLAERALAGAMTEADDPAANDDSDLAPRLLFLGLARDFQGRHAEAVPSLERACGRFAASAGERALATANARTNLARVYVSVGRHAEAEALFMAVFREENAPPSSTALALNGLGLIHREAGRYDEAIGLFEQALELFARQPEIGPGDAVTVLQNLAAACEAKGDSAGARSARERALDLERRHADAAAGMG
jgi:tetratricopeptide (TPR) repeat protein